LASDRCLEKAPSLTGSHRAEALGDLSAITARTMRKFPSGGVRKKA